MTLERLSSRQVNAMQPSKELIDHTMEMINAKMLSAKTKNKLEPPPAARGAQNRGQTQNKGHT